MKFNRLNTPNVYNRKEKEKFFKSVFEMNKEKNVLRYFFMFDNTWG